MRTITVPSAMREWADDERRSVRTIGFVPTMGALHAGHMELMRTAKRLTETTVVSIFVNPLQFGEQNDLESYPRPIDNDLEICATAGVDVVYAPTAAAMYPADFQTQLTLGPLAEVMEGASRTGHFDGVATVVTKLFNAVLPHVAVFGEKDFQQLAIIRQMTRDLDLGIEIVGQPTVREPDGLAISSRNTRLDTNQRRAAACFPRTLDAAAKLALEEGYSPAEIIEASHSRIADEPLARVDYLSIFDATTLQSVSKFTLEQRRPGQVRIGGAVRFGDVRLIDNRDLFSP
ncbi:MAG: pantoate--beta-alanine ligase [Actinobacteria bacterium]|nr:MAG: pantoate--beta-alanine ligase [Actinomycetota bacterium]